MEVHDTVILGLQSSSQIWQKSDESKGKTHLESFLQQTDHTEAKATENYQ